jgi:dihydropteroate synthase
LAISQRKKYSLNWGENSLQLNNRTLIMGVLNVTPDSFSDGGLYFNKDAAIERGLALEHGGADIIDIGGESTRPYSEEVSLEDELARVIPVIDALKDRLKIPISIDTCKAEVAKQALKAGASMINDISALRFDPAMVSVAAEAGVPLILMHMKGTPGDMQDNPVYNDLISEIFDFLNNAIGMAEKAGIKKDMIILDPGIGFGKSFDHNLTIIRDLARFKELDRPIILGTSRKAFIGQILGRNPEERDVGTMATLSAGILNGAHIVRVHNVKMAFETVRVIDSIRSGRMI